MQEPSIESVSSLARCYWQQYEGKTGNLCQYYVGFMSVYETDINLYYIENKVFTLKSMSDVSKFKNFILYFHSLEKIAAKFRFVLILSVLSAT